MSSPSASSSPGIAFCPPAIRGIWITSPAGLAAARGRPWPPGSAVGSLGSDTGGSIRGPAAFSGIAGIKPTYGRCSRAGVVTLSWTLDHTGPMARSVEDCAYLLQALAGHDPADPASSQAPVGDYHSVAARRYPRPPGGRPARLLLRRDQPRDGACLPGGPRRAAFARSHRARRGDSQHPSVDGLHGDHAGRGLRLPRARPARAAPALR